MGSSSGLSQEWSCLPLDAESFPFPGWQWPACPLHWAGVTSPGVTGPGFIPSSTSDREGGDRAWQAKK